MTAALSLRNLHVAYDQVAAVRGVDLDVDEGEAVAVIGSNGAGKTSLLRGIMGLARAAAAEIHFNGVSIASMRTHAIARGGIGYVPEGRELFPGLTVKEELLLGGRFLPRAEREAKLQEIHLLFPRLMERRSQITRTLSGGEQQMVAIARALMTKPRLLLLDEPSLGLAPVIQDVVYAALARLRQKERMPMLLVEQNANRALHLCSRAYVLELGSITRSADSLYALYAVGFTMIFGIMGVLNMAHADFGTVAAFVIIWAVSAGLAPIETMLIACAATLVIALMVERLALRPGRRFKGDAAIEMPLIGTIGASMMLQNTAALVFGNKAMVFPYSLRGFMRIGGLLVSKGLLVSLSTSAVLLVLLEILVTHTGFGRQMRAVAQNRNAAEIMGIRSEA